MIHSNPITDILDRADWTKTTPSGYLDDKALERKAASLQALYEAVKGCVPDEIDFRGNGSEWNDCRTKTLTNLSLLFGQAGGLERHNDEK